MKYYPSREFLRMFSEAIFVQAVLSITSLIVGLILIRRAPDEQYGYYVLTLNVVMLVTALQTSFIQSQMVNRLAGASSAARANLIGGLFRDQRWRWPIVAALIVVVAIALWMKGVLNAGAVWVGVAAAIAVLASLFREFFRMVLLSYRRPAPVLRADIVYSLLLIGGALLATLSPAPAALAALAMSLAALVGGLICSKSLWRIEPWNVVGEPGILRAIAPLGAWTSAGAAIHWLFSQGYNFLVAGTLGVDAVAAIAATRILIMPVNLVSTGIGTLMLPTISKWLQTRSTSSVLYRQLLIATALGLAAIGYFVLLWSMRDWLFANVLKKHLAQRDELLSLWYAVGLLMLLRDQLVYLLLSKLRYRILTVLTLLSALIALGTSYFGMLRVGPPGALLGIVAGELVNVTGLIALSLREARKTPPRALKHGSASPQELPNTDK
jgi:O-antigen/teichoic acid export membrane protein